MESMLESQFLRQHGQTPRAAPTPAPALPMFRPAAHTAPMSIEERAVLLARSHLLRSSFPPPPSFPPTPLHHAPTPPPTRPLALPQLPGLWSQWVQLQHLNSQLLLAQQTSSPPSLFSSLLSQAKLTVSPPSPTLHSRTPSPVQVDT